MERLLAIMAALRDPESGCPWDLKQTFETIAPYTIEEAYEVADAIARKDLEGLKEELGDLLLQVVYHARIAEEDGSFAFADVAEAISEKMVRRHPHLFGEASSADAREQSRAWEEIKAAERQTKGASQGALAGVPMALPALARAAKLTDRARRVGFFWAEAEAILAKVREELAELEAEIAAEDADKTEEELGDLLFVIANLARKLEIDPEAALRGANAKFARRFTFIEEALAVEGRSAQDSSLEEMDALWNAAKAAEREKSRASAGP
ncbi:MAG: nucleoside triphosphate pyrophosphohydrolase [Caulobacteraceae bacterium]